MTGLKWASIVWLLSTLSLGVATSFFPHLWARFVSHGVRLPKQLIVKGEVLLTTLSPGGTVLSNLNEHFVQDVVCDSEVRSNGLWLSDAAMGKVFGSLDLNEKPPPLRAGAVLLQLRRFTRLGKVRWRAPNLCRDTG